MPDTVSRPNTYDVAVIGGGPAGATVSTFLARHGRRVVLFEKNPHPRFHIGESLLPKNLPVLERLGLSREISRMGIYKPGVEFVSPDHDKRQCFFFCDAIDPAPPYAYQVLRSAFDDILFRNAAAAGVDMRNGCEITGGERFAGGWRLNSDGPSPSGEVIARYLIDASGRDGFLARKYDLRHRNRDHNSAALFAHYRDVSPDAWETSGNIIVFWFEHGWIWMIPLPDGITSIGAVCMPDYLKTRTNKLDEFFEDTLRLCPKIWEILTGATRATPVHGAGNYAYKAESAFGDNYLLLGDAYAFIDPVFSTGVFLAMTSGERAARLVDSVLDHPERAIALQRRYQRELNRAIKRISWFIYRFNSPAFKRLFMSPRNVLGVRSTVVSALTGDLYRGAIFDWRLAVFKVIYEVSRMKHFQTDRAALERQKKLPKISLPEYESSAGA